MSRAFSRTLLNAAADDETKAEFIPAAGESIPTNGYTHIIRWGSSVSAGVVEIEGSYTTADAATWAPIATITYTSGSPKIEYVFSPAMFPVMRHRISTAVSGGTVTTKLSGSY